MIQDYFQNLKKLWTDPSGFFQSSSAFNDPQKSMLFAVKTGLLVGLEWGFTQVLQGGTSWIIWVVTLLLLVLMPFLVLAWVYLWSWFLELSVSLLGDRLPILTVRQVTAYSVGGWVVSVVGWGLGKWLALATLVFQVLGLEKGLRCTRWTALVYVGLPFSMAAVLTGFLTLMFKVFK